MAVSGETGAAAITPDTALWQTVTVGPGAVEVATKVRTNVDDKVVVGVTVSMIVMSTVVESVDVVDVKGVESTVLVEAKIVVDDKMVIVDAGRSVLAIVVWGIVVIVNTIVVLVNFPIVLVTVSRVSDGEKTSQTASTRLKLKL